MTLTATNKTSAKARPTQAATRRESGKRFIAGSIRLGEIDDHGIGVEEKCHHREEERGVAQVDDAAQDCVEMRVEAERGDDIEDPGRRPILQESEHDGRAGHGQEETDRRRHHKGDDLILRERRERRANREITPRHQEAADIARQDHAIVGMTQHVHRDPERESEDEGDPGENPCGEELAQNRGTHRDRQGQEQLDGAALSLLRPKPHRQRRYQHEVKPGMEAEEADEIILAAIEEISEEESEGPGKNQEDHDEHVSERRGEITGELATENNVSAMHRAPAYAALSVMARKTSSRRPRSTRIPEIGQPAVRTRSVTSATIGRPARGKIIKPGPSRSLTFSTDWTLGKRNSAVSALEASPANASRTALWWRERASSSAGVPSARSLPRAMIAARVHTASTSSRICVEMMIALVGASAVIKVRTWCF